MENFNDAQFRERVDKALTQVRKILKAERNQTYMESVQHTYSDKFGLAEFLTNISLAAQINCFQMMGIEGANAAEAGFGGAQVAAVSELLSPAQGRKPERIREAEAPEPRYDGAPANNSGVPVFELPPGPGVIILGP